MCNKKVSFLNGTIVLKNANLSLFDSLLNSVSSLSESKSESNTPFPISYFFLI